MNDSLPASMWVWGKIFPSVSSQFTWRHYLERLVRKSYNSLKKRFPSISSLVIGQFTWRHYILVDWSENHIAGGLRSFAGQIWKWFEVSWNLLWPHRVSVDIISIVGRYRHRHTGLTTSLTMTLMKISDILASTDHR